MAKIQKIILPSGETVDAEEVDISQTSEHWNQYLLEDGSLIKIKLVASKIVRVVDRFDSVGNPIYLINSSNVIAVDSPDGLKKK